MKPGKFTKIYTCTWYILYLCTWVFKETVNKKKDVVKKNVAIWKWINKFIDAISWNFYLTLSLFFMSD